MEVLPALFHQFVVSLDVFLAQFPGELERRVDGEFRADHLAQVAIHALMGLARQGLRRVISLDIEFLGEDEDPVGAEFNAVSASLASICDNMKLPYGDGMFLGIEGQAPEFHNNPSQKKTGYSLFITHVKGFELSTLRK
jgi:hypothetical protein